MKELPEEENELFAEELAGKMVEFVIHHTVEVCDGDVAKAVKLKKHILDIVALSKASDNPIEFYEAITILSVGILKISELKKKWIDERHENT